MPIRFPALLRPPQPGRLRWLRLSVPGLLLLAALLPVLAMARGLHYGVTAWDMRDGLPHNMIHSIAQDRQGFI